MAAAGNRTPGVTVVVTVLRDLRFERTVRSLLLQDHPPTEILVDDGGGPGPVRDATLRLASVDPRVVYLDAPGSIAESRNSALARVRTDLVAFADADEVAPPTWLGQLASPFADPRVGFTGGPTPALPGTASTVGARYYDGYLRRFYDEVARHRPHALPMGNSAWRMAVFDQVGLLDTTLFPGAASEDQEVALRALRAGWQGVYVPSASLDHDFSGLTLAGLLRKQSRYALGGYVVWRRRGSTYEATGGRLAPYLVPPAAIVVGGILAIFPSIRWGGELIALAGVAALALLAAALAVEGAVKDAQFPGYRFRPVEILRRWATTVGAFRGFLRYGWSGTKGVATRSPPSPSGKP